MPSRAERRAYERMTKNQDPRALPVNPAHKARADRIAQRRAVAKAAAPQRASRTYWIRAIVAALLLGLTAFSVAWDGGDGMPLALYIGIGAVAVVLVAAVALRSVLTRAADAARSRGATPRR
jgi:hypothetical protein